jgi:hypothetical protein
MPSRSGHLRGARRTFTWERFFCALIVLVVLIKFLLSDLVLSGLSGHEYRNGQHASMAAMIGTGCHSGRDSMAPSYPVRAFWHIGDMGNDTWRLVFKEQLERIYTSGLLDTMNVTATFVGPNASAMPVIKDPRISLEYGGGSDMFEYPSLKKLEAYCLQVGGCVGGGLVTGMHMVVSARRVEHAQRPG